MDVAAARTFLAIVEGGNFVAAAQRLNVTQSTISARIRNLEDALGRQLFIRNKSGCEMTPAGRQFHRYARAMVRAWEEGRHQVGVPDQFDSVLSVAGQYSLWNRLLMRWLPEFRRAAPRTAIRASVGMPQRLLREMAEGILDIAVIYQPEHRPGLTVEHLFDDELILVTADKAKSLAENYVFIDWGEAFRRWHAAEHERMANPGVTLDLGALSVNHLVNNGGAGYLPRRIAAPFVEEGYLHLSPDGGVFPYPAYIVWQDGYTHADVMALARETLHEIAKRAGRGDLPPPFWA